MDRRQFLSLEKPPVKLKQDFSHVARTQSGINPYSGPWTISEVRHLLKRTMFGSTRDDINYFTGQGMQSAIEELMEIINHPPYTAPVPPVNNYDNLVSDPNCPAGMPWAGTADTNNGTIYTYTSRKRSLKSWWISQMLIQPRSIREKMVLFWSNHFVIELDTVTVSTYVYKYNELLREYALGNFKEFVKQITMNSAMLKYLNGERNTATAPNENYGRELQELFTIGKDATGNPPYTEDDVKAAARVLTGWRNDLVGGTTSANGFNSYFDPNKHDTADKLFSAFYNNTVITGQSGSGAVAELDQLLDMIFSKDEVSLFICRKLYRFFVYYDIDATTEQNVIVPLAAILRSNNYEILPVLQTLFSSEHFYDVLNQGCMIKNPIDFTVSLCREFGVVFPDGSNLAGQYGCWDKVRSTASGMQQDIGDPPNVAGWSPYYQEPSYHEIWINSDTLPKRNQFTDRMISYGYTSYGGTIVLDVVAYTETLTNPLDPVTLIEEVLALHYCIDVSQNLRNYLLSILLSGQSSNSYWTNAWDDYTGDPTNTTYYNIVKTRLKQFYGYIMDLSEYQLS
ncbi:MAG TPA: DUF1800 domain-containing protein [Bacteroidia bacterium]|nr:DUF1800 domain-containing protein [Bacteroidia bacterium]